jgi:hypothetical protein
MRSHICLVTVLLVTAGGPARADTSASATDRLAYIGHPLKAAIVSAARAQAEPARETLALFERDLLRLAEDTLGPGRALPLEGWDVALEQSLGLVTLARRHQQRGDYVAERGALERIELVWARLRTGNGLAHRADHLVLYRDEVQKAEHRMRDEEALRRLLPSLVARASALRGSTPPTSPEQRTLFARDVDAVAASVAALEGALAAKSTARIQSSVAALRARCDDLYEDFR